MSLSQQQLPHFNVYGYVVVEGLLDPPRDLEPIFHDYEAVLGARDRLSRASTVPPPHRWIADAPLCA